MGQVIFTSGPNENTAVMELEIDKVSQASSLRIIASKMLAVLCAALLLLDTRGAGSPHFKDCLAIIGKLKFPTQKNKFF